MSADEVIALAAELVEALGPEPDEETERAADSWNEDEGRPKNPRELEASESPRREVIERRRLVDNAETFLCEAADWDSSLLSTAERSTPAGRFDDAHDVEPFDKWTLILLAGMTCWRATADPNEPSPDHRAVSIADDLASTFVSGLYRFTGGPNAAYFRRCDQQAALAAFDRVHAENPRDWIGRDPVTDRDLELARMDLLLWEPTGIDKRADADR